MLFLLLNNSYSPTKSFRPISIHHYKNPYKSKTLSILFMITVLWVPIFFPIVFFYAISSNISIFMKKVLGDSFKTKV
jgi:hypothetical protein